MSDVAKARKAKTDLYANKAYGEVTMSAANTLTFSQILMGVGLFQGIGMLIHRILWRPTPDAMREVVTIADSFYVGLTSSNRVSDLIAIDDPAIIAQESLVGVGAAVEPRRLPWVTDFTTLPGGGKIIPANPLWVAAMSGGFANPGGVRVELEFTFVSLSDKDYMELIQSLFPANIA